MQPAKLIHRRPIPSLIIAFTAWKALLLLVAACAPGPGYDTSTALALGAEHGDAQLPTPLHFLISKLTRWDAIYFVRVANRGYRFEQEWAFGWGFTRLIALCTAAIERIGVPRYDGLEAVVAISIAHSAHLLAVLVLYQLTSGIFIGVGGVALTAAALHIISPAGLFLSAPYAESSCALLTFSGCLLFTKSLGRKSAGRDLLVLASGIVFGAATTFRSNGILNGLLLLEEAFRTLFLLRDGLHLSTIRRLLATGLGGVAVGVGFLLPQYIAYSEYCTNPSTTELRPWCERTVPSIYAFVQAHYWNNGLFKYWTLSNLPLFLLGAPMFAIMTVSGLNSLRQTPFKEPKTGVKTAAPSESQRLQVIWNLAAAQLLLTAFNLTTGHVQIITRISSASPVWVWYLALGYAKGLPWAQHFVTFMVMYSVVQGGLFASFLPPA